MREIRTAYDAVQNELITITKFICTRGSQIIML